MPYLAKEPIYESVEGADEGVQRLAVAAGAEVRDEDFERLGLKKSDSRVEKVEDDRVQAWYVKNRFVAAEQLQE
jgi:hypothetical protein